MRRRNKRLKPHVSKTPSPRAKAKAKVKEQQINKFYLKMLEQVIIGAGISLGTLSLLNWIKKNIL